MTLFSALKCTTPSALTPKPQSKVMIDESMCPWLGSADRDTRGMPHKIVDENQVHFHLETRCCN